MRKYLPLLIILSFCHLALAQEQFSDLDWLGEYTSIKGDARSLGVNMNFRPPAGWKQEESVRPHIVRKYISFNGAIILLILTEYPTFISRNEFLASYEDFSKEVINGFGDIMPNQQHYHFLQKTKTTIDKYPFFVYNFLVESTHIINGKEIKQKQILKQFLTIYEDVSISIQGWIPTDKDMDFFDMWIDAVVHSIVFPDQYE